MVTGIGYSMRSSIVCFARGHDTDWQALYLDFDIAVEGVSFAGVQGKIETAIKDYVDAAKQESPADCKMLLTRRAPWGVTISWFARAVWYALRHRLSGPGNSGEAIAQFPVFAAT